MWRLYSLTGMPAICRAHARTHAHLRMAGVPARTHSIRLQNDDHDYDEAKGAIGEPAHCCFWPRPVRGTRVTRVLGHLAQRATEHICRTSECKRAAAGDAVAAAQHGKPCT